MNFQIYKCDLYVSIDCTYCLDVVTVQYSKNYFTILLFECVRYFSEHREILIGHAQQHFLCSQVFNVMLQSHAVNLKGLYFIKRVHIITLISHM